MTSKRPNACTDDARQLSIDHLASYKKVPVVKNFGSQCFRSPSNDFSSISSTDSEESLPPHQRDVSLHIYDSRPETEPNAEEDDEISACTRNSPRCTPSAPLSTSRQTRSSSIESASIKLLLSSTDEQQTPQTLPPACHRPSSNPFKSMGSKPSQQQRAKRISSSNCPYSPSTPKHSPRIREKLSKCNINEAAMLFSLSSIDKKQK